MREPDVCGPTEQDPSNDRGPGRGPERGPAQAKFKREICHIRDLFDYWPDVQHPVGYHPSTACSADATHTRNMPTASQVFGAAHLVCDAHAYAAPGHRLNPFYMQSRWVS